MPVSNPIRFRGLIAALLSVSAWGAAAEPALRPSASLLFHHADLVRPGSCVLYREGGGGWVLTAPQYWLRGTVAASEIRQRRLEQCPELPGKTKDQASREEFVRLVTAYPCLAPGDAPREHSLGVVRVTVQDWETPWSRRAATNGRLFQGHYLDQPLRPGAELEIEADLLVACAP